MTRHQERTISSSNRHKNSANPRSIYLFPWDAESRNTPLFSPYRFKVVNMMPDRHQRSFLEEIPLHHQHPGYLTPRKWSKLARGNPIRRQNITKERMNQKTDSILYHTSVKTGSTHRRVSYVIVRCGDEVSNIRQFVFFDKLHQRRVTKR